MAHGKLNDSGRSSKMCVYNTSLSYVMNAPMQHNATLCQLQICLDGTQKKK